MSKRHHSSGQDSVLTPTRKQKPPKVKTPNYKMEEKLDKVLKQNGEMMQMMKGFPVMEATLEKISKTMKDQEDAIVFNQAEIKDLQEKGVMKITSQFPTRTITSRRLLDSM